jgi:hypothetical protein
MLSSVSDLSDVTNKSSNIPSYPVKNSSTIWYSLEVYKILPEDTATSFFPLQFSHRHIKSDMQSADTPRNTET